MTEIDDGSHEPVSTIAEYEAEQYRGACVRWPEWRSCWSTADEGQLKEI